MLARPSSLPSAARTKIRDPPSKRGWAWVVALSHHSHHVSRGRSNAAEGGPPPLVKNCSEATYAAKLRTLHKGDDDAFTRRKRNRSLTKGTLQHVMARIQKNNRRIGSSCFQTAVNHCLCAKKVPDTRRKPLDLCVCNTRVVTENAVKGAHVYVHNFVCLSHARDESDDSISVPGEGKSHSDGEKHYP